MQSWVEQRVIELGQDQSATEQRFDSMDRQLGSIENKVDKILDAVQVQGTRLTVLETNEKNRSAKYKLIAGVAAAVVTTVALSVLGLG